MWKFIEKLRSLPEESRKAVVIFSSAGITSLILVSWLIFPVPHFGSLSDAAKERKNAENLITPFSAIGGQIDQGVAGIKDTWASLGGTAGILSAVTTIKENIAQGVATSTSVSTSTPEVNQNREALSEQEMFLADSHTASSSDTVAIHTATTTEQ